MNLSARQLWHPSLVEDVEGALRESGLDPRWLVLEITESAMVKDEERHIDTLRALRDLGVRFALDDFGAGYSSLSYLKRLPVSMLKIDRSFVGRIGENAEDEALLSGVVGIAHGLRLRVLAEGVETPGQLERVKALGCELAQGHYFSESLPAKAMASCWQPESARVDWTARFLRLLACTKIERASSSARSELVIPTSSYRHPPMAAS